MSLKNAPRKRLPSAVAVVLFAGLSAGAHAADNSLPDTVTSAFETVVIDAAAAASKAKEVLTKTPFKKTAAKKNDNAGKDEAEKAADKEAGEKADKADKSSDHKLKGAVKDDKTPSTNGKPAADKADKTAGDKDKPAAGKGDKVDPADPAAKAAADTKALDPKTGKPIEAPKKPAIATEWPAVEVDLARARCTQLLKGVDAVTIPEPPFRKGDCGAMAPVRLVSIGKNPEVSLSPPPVVSCDLVIALTKWMKNEVQPSARRHLGSEVIRVESMSDYSCRMAYGRIGNKLSEHGKANALDIRGFITRKGNQAVVLSDWGQTARDIKKQIAAAKAAAAKADAVKVAAEKADKERAEAAEVAAKSATTNTPLSRKTLVEGLPPKADPGPSLALPAAITKDGALGMAPTHLGGPKAKTAEMKEDKKGKSKEAAKRDKAKSDGTVAALPPADGVVEPIAPPPPKTATSRFLHEVHASACQIFGTTLGPEANEAHRNHFHVDMAERKVRKICD
ncbi:extensin family protein [Hyphomicrobium sp.]|uniref:extensin family protein n=1 Tax=Hyphomicrobium sp. TaxID=82 RepID=UPI002E2EE4D6|nr:extensin family protein [Hyphomicrobium sp.]HEX2842656.1 extensin family protein [Hyphomicrobium sp.]